MATDSTPTECEAGDVREVRLRRDLASRLRIVLTRVRRIDAYEDDIQAIVDDLAPLIAKRERAAKAEALREVLALHVPDRPTGDWCDHDGFSWPCPTRRAAALAPETPGADHE